MSCCCTEGSIKLVDEGDEFALEMPCEPSGSSKSGTVKAVDGMPGKVDGSSIDGDVENDDAMSVDCPCDTCEDRC